MRSRNSRLKAPRASRWRHADDGPRHPVHPGGGVALSGPGSDPLLGNVVPIASARTVPQVAFDRLELLRILDLYGRMVAAGQWRDYAMDFGREAANFSVFRRTAERPTARIEKRPALRARQGMWALYGEAGQVLKRGHELANVLAPLERRLLKVVED